MLAQNGSPCCVGFAVPPPGSLDCTPPTVLNEPTVQKEKDRVTPPRRKTTDYLLASEIPIHIDTVAVPTKRKRDTPKK
jgi:hypothetical protein